MRYHETMRQPGATRCHGCAVRSSGFCSAFDAESLVEFSAHSSWKSYDRGTEIATQGEPSDRVGVIARGLVKVVMLTERGEEHLLQILRSGQLVGIPGSETSGFAVETATDADMCWMPRPIWERFLRERPQHFRACLVTMTQQLEELQLSVVKMRGRSTLERVALWLLQQLPQRSGEAAPVIRIELTRRDLASLLDMTVETLCRSLRRLDEKGAIDLITPDCAEIVDLGTLRLLAGDDAVPPRPSSVSARPAEERQFWQDWSDRPAGNDHHAVAGSGPARKGRATPTTH